MLSDDREKTVQYILIERGKMAQKEYKSWHLLRKAIHSELYQRLTFGHADKLYAQSVPGNETQRLP